MLALVLLSIAAYLFGSFPTAYVFAKKARGIDIRQYGSGAVSVSNVASTVSWWALFPIGVADVLKGAVPFWVARAFGLDLGERFIVALCAVAGHNWPIFLRFRGGRGMAPSLGILFAGAWQELVTFIIVAGAPIGLTRNVPLFMALGFLVLPFTSAFLLREPAAITYACTAMAGVMLAKRVWGRDPGALRGANGRSVLWYRLLYDRDTRERRAWVHQRPANGAG